MAIVSLIDMRFHAFHGFYEEEQLAGGEFIVDLWVDVKLSGKEAKKDNLEKTVNYETLYLFCQLEMKKTSKLIETVAQRIVDRIQGQFGGQVEGVRIHLKKMHPPLGGALSHASVALGVGTLLVDPVQTFLGTSILLNRIK